MQTQNKRYVQYGCGLSAPEGWLNFDSSPTLRFERLPVLGRLYTRNVARFPDAVRYGDVVKGLPIEKGSCEGMYCSHVLEHLALEEFRVALRHTYDLLKAGGIFRLVLPDLERSIKEYLASSDSGAAVTLLKETSLGKEKRPQTLKELLVEWLGSSQHLWMWDYKAIERELQEAGFVRIRRASFGDSSDPAYQSVEDENRWDNSLGVECFKPS